MRALVALGLLLPAAAAGAGKELVVDVPAEIRERLFVVTDGAGVYWIYPDARLDQSIPQPNVDRREFIFVGDGKTFRRARPERGGLIGGKYFYWLLWDPRVEALDGVGIYLDESGKHGVYCGKKDLKLTRLAAADEKAMVAAARFVEGPFGRQEYALARDERGIYYYVDRGLGPTFDFRLYVGPRGAMKLQKMKNVVRDSAGDVFASRSGELRLVLNKADGKREGFWVKGKKRTPLVTLPLDENEGLIYNDLGVYVGIPYGSPCDDKRLAP
jgi:hypothetical protein